MRLILTPTARTTSDEEASTVVRLHWPSRPETGARLRLADVDQPEARVTEHTIIVDCGSGSVAATTPGAQETLNTYFGPGPATFLPAEIAHWLLSCERGETPERGSVPSLKVRRGSASLVVRLLQATPNVAVLVLQESEGFTRPAAIPLQLLTPRENEVLEWILEGKRNREIGVILGLSTRTVGKHVEHVFQKLGVETRTAAVRMLLEVRDGARSPGEDARHEGLAPLRDLGRRAADTIGMATITPIDASA